MSIAADAPKLWLAVQVPSDVNGPLLECWFDMVVVCIVAEQLAAAAACCFVWRARGEVGRLVVRVG